MVHVHTDMETLRADGLNGQAELEDGGTIAAETARRVSCDAGLVHEGGIHITPKTAQCLLLGETMDDNMAIQVMLQLQ